MLHAVSSTSAIPLVRPSGPYSAEIMRFLDAGSYGIICPMISTRTDAETLVAACRYPPLGQRSFGPARAQLYGGADYLRHANAEILALAMIETAEGLRNLDAILDTPGLDGIYVGPNDLSLALGYAPRNEPVDDEVRVAIERIRAACTARGDDRWHLRERWRCRTNADCRRFWASDAGATTPRCCAPPMADAGPQKPFNRVLMHSILIPGTLCDARVFEALSPGLAEPQNLDYREHTSVAVAARGLLSAVPQGSLGIAFSLGRDGFCWKCCGSRPTVSSAPSSFQAMLSPMLRGNAESRLARVQRGRDIGLRRLIDEQWSDCVGPSSRQDSQRLRLLQSMAEDLGTRGSRPSGRNEPVAPRPARRRRAQRTQDRRDRRRRRQTLSARAVSGLAERRHTTSQPWRE